MAPELSRRERSADYFRPRLVVAALVVLAVTAVLVGRLWQLQFIERSEYSELSQKNRMRVIRLFPSRGRVLDREGRLLADNKPSFALSVLPAELENPLRVIEVGSPVLGLSPERMRRLIERSRSYPRFMAYPVKKNLSLEQVSLVKARAANLKGVVLQTRTLRTYPMGKTLCHVIGTLGEISPRELRQSTRLGYRSGDLVGKSGIEKEYENFLKGEEGWERIEIDAKGRQLARLSRKEPEKGSDISLTVDAELQRYVDEVFINRAGSVVALDPDTGEVLVLYSKPGFDLNLFSPTISKRQWRNLTRDPLHPLENRAIRGLYSPASAFKIVTAAAGLAEGVVRPNEKIVCKGKLELGNQVFRCWNRAGHGKVDFHRSLMESCDVYFYELGLRLGADRLAQYALLFGFGKPTGLGLPHELPGLVPTSAWKQRTHGVTWKDGETLTVAIGQGYLLCTPIQLALMTAAVANGGKVLKPTVVNEIRSASGKVIYRHEPIVRWKIPFDEEILKRLRAALKAVVADPRGTGRQFALPDIEGAGKTGTSQVIRLRQGAEEGETTPYHERTHAIFVGYVTDMPKKIALVVVVEHGGRGGASAAPIARKIVARYYGVEDPGDEEEASSVQAAQRQ